MIKRIRGLTILPAMLLALSAQAQTMTPATINASGGSKELAGNTYGYSIGEMTLVHTVATPNLVVTQGILQPQDKALDISELALPSDALTVYPNPSDDIVYIQPKMEGSGALILTLMDITGRKLQEQKAVLTTGMEKQSMSLSSLAAGTYLLQAAFSRNNKSFVRNFKIQKLK